MHCVPILLLRTRTATSARDFSASTALHEEIQKETTTRHINMEEKRRARGREHCSGRRGAAMAEACDKRIIILAVFVRVICHFFAPYHTEPAAGKTAPAGMFWRGLSTCMYSTIAPWYWRTDPVTQNSNPGHTPSALRMMIEWIGFEMCL
jgi:hypothetical protein